MMIKNHFQINSTAMTTVLLQREEIVKKIRRNIIEHSMQSVISSF